MGRKKCRCTISPMQATKIAAMMGSGFGLPKDTSPNLPQNWLLNLPLRTRKTGSKPAEELTLRQLLEKTMVTKRGLPPSLDASSDEISIRTQRGSGDCQHGSGLREHWAKNKGKYKAAAGLAGIAAAGAQQFAPQARSAATDVREATHTAGVVRENLQTARSQAQSGNVIAAARSATCALRYHEMGVAEQTSLCDLDLVWIWFVM